MGFTTNSLIGRYSRTMEVFAPLEGRAWIQPGSRETYEDPEGVEKGATNSKGRGKAASNADAPILIKNEIVIKDQPESDDAAPAPVVVSDPNPAQLANVPPLRQWTPAQDARLCELHAQHMDSMNTLIALALSAQNRRIITGEDVERRLDYLYGPQQDQSLSGYLAL